MENYPSFADMGEEETRAGAKRKGAPGGDGRAFEKAMRMHPQYGNDEVMEDVNGHAVEAGAHSNTINLNAVRWDLACLLCKQSDI
jgi:hypothetical protein